MRRGDKRPGTIVGLFPARAFVRGNNLVLCSSGIKTEGAARPITITTSTPSSVVWGRHHMITRNDPPLTCHISLTNSPASVTAARCEIVVIALTTKKSGRRWAIGSQSNTNRPVLHGTESQKLSRLGTPEADKCSI
ncbi:hypothetical protein BaRGS_00017343 [Batillaria attramentaria]|uniref:Uncharacterized protein n=1 Tax=Batillaria attramentaria TaxID=370345 RepID=A0ABD0KX76_9CAEN